MQSTILSGRIPWDALCIFTQCLQRIRSILELIDGLPLDKQQAICRYPDDHVTKRAHGQQSKAPALNGKKVKSNERER